MKTMKFYNVLFVLTLVLSVVTLLSYADLRRTGLFPKMLLDLIWNMMPIIAFYFMFRKGLPYLKSRLLLLTLILAGLALVLVPVLFCLTMLYQRIFGGGTSTSAIGFMFVPLYALMLGLIPGTWYLLKLEKIINSEE